MYSLASRPKEPKRYVTPAPGAYEVADTNHYKSKAPAFSLSTRYTVPSDTSMKPGPGTYTPEKVGSSLCSKYVSYLKIYLRAQCYKTFFGGISDN